MGVLKKGFGHEQSEADVDVLAMLAPRTAHEHDPRLSRVEAIDRALNIHPNTASFDNASYPAISVPASTGEALSVGIMFIGEAFDDKTVLGVADTYAGSVNFVSF
jgi:amidase